MTSTVPDVAQDVSQIAVSSDNRASSTVTASDVAQVVSRVVDPSYNRDTSAVTTLHVTPYISDQSFMSSCNRGPITTAFVHPSSCNDTLRNDEDTLANPFYLGIGTSVSTGLVTLREL